MSIISIDRLGKSIGARVLLRDASLGIEEGEKLGFIGPNGAGKSTFFRILAGAEPADSGEIAIRRGASLGYLAQEPELPSGLTIRDAVAAGRPELMSTLHEYHEVARRLAAGEEDDPDRTLRRQGELSARIDALDGWSWERDVDTILSRVGIDETDRVVDRLSGGERKRVALARVLLERPDILLLDEPTNHLDADTTLWLEDHLLDYPGTVLLVTHDRYFLDRVVTRMIEIEDHGFSSFTGGYTEYLEARAERAERRAQEAGKREKLIAQELAWVKRSPAARTGKQKARIKRLEAAQARSAAEPGRRESVDLSFAPPPRLGRTVLEVHDLRKGFGERELISGLTTRIRAGERIGIIGPNGAGKTSLLRIILGELEADEGEVRLGTNTRIAYFDQKRSELDPAISVYDSMGGQEWVEVAGRRVHVRSYLDSFLFPASTHQQRVGSLSGGERNRLLLARLLLEDANLLILDEPTNDLDLETLQALEAALVDFGGTVLVVTHDRFFLDKVATGLLVFEGDGEVHEHVGGYDLYRRLREGEAEREREERAARSESRGKDRRQTSVAGDGRSRKPRKLTYREQQELAGIEAAIVEAESARDALSSELTNPALYAETPERVQSTREAFEAAERRVEELYERWAELEEIASSG